MAFSSGFRAGVSAVQDYRQGERQKVLDQQADQRFGREQLDWTRADEARAREDAAWKDYDTALQPTTPAQGLTVPTARVAAPPTGVTPGRDMGSGQATSLQSGNAGVEAPTDTSLAPAAPAPAQAPSQLDRERALGRISAARRDVGGVRTSQQNEKTLRMGEVANTVAKMSDDEIAAQAKTLNTNNSNVPLLYAGKGKGGYTFMTMSPDGEPGNQFKLNIAQMRQLVLSNQLAQQGYGTEALDLASRTHTAIGTAMGEWNKTMGEMGKNNNTAAHFQSSDANDAARTGEMARHNRASEGQSAERMNREDWQIVGASDDNKGLMRFNKRTGQTVVQPLPDGTDAAGLFRRVTGTGAASAPKEVPAAGTIMSDGKRTFKADGMGGMLAPKAPMLEERPKVLDKAGIEPGFAADLQWDPSGQYVRFGGMNYDVTKPSDLSQLRKDTVRLAAGNKAVDEGQLGTFREGALKRQALERQDPNYFENPERPAFRYAAPR